MDVVAHVLPQRRAPVALRDDVLGPGDRQRRHGLDRPAPLVRLAGIGLVELLGRHLRRRRLVHPDLVVEPAGGLRSALHHQVAPDLVGVVAQPVRIASGGRQQQQPRRLDRVAGDGDGTGALAVLAPVVEVGDAGGPTGGVVDEDAADHAVGTDLGTVREGVGDVGDQRAGLGVDLAPLQAEAAVDAVRPVAEAAVGDRDRADPGLDAGRLRAAQEDVAVATDRVGVVRVRVRVAPRPVLAGDRQLLLDRLVERLQLAVGQWPVGPYPVRTEGMEVGRVEARRVAGVVHHRPADAASGVVRAQRDGVAAADLARFGPVQRVRPALVGDPVPVRVPERPGVQADHLPAGAGQALGEDAAAGTGAHHHQVDLVLEVVAAHVPPQLMIRAAAVLGDEPGRLVTRPDLAVVASHRSASLPDRSACSCLARSMRSANGTGSRSKASATSHFSRALTPGFRYPRG